MTDDFNPEVYKQLLIELRTRSVNRDEPTDEEWTAAVQGFIACRELERANEPSTKKKKAATQANAADLLKSLIKIN